MPGITTFDASSRGSLGKQATIPEIALEAVLATSSNVEANNHLDNVRIIEPTIVFATLLIALMPFFFYSPQIYCLREWFKGCLKPKCWYRVWPRYIFDLVWGIVNLFCIIAFQEYFHTHGALVPPESNRDKDIFIATLVFLVIFFLARYLWINTFWNYHNTKNIKNPERGPPEFSRGAAVSLGFALFFAIVMVVCAIAFVVMFGIIQDWVAFAFVMPLLIWSIVLLVWTGMIWNCIGKWKCPPIVESCNLSSINDKKSINYNAGKNLKK